MEKFPQPQDSSENQTKKAARESAKRAFELAKASEVMEKQTPEDENNDDMNPGVSALGNFGEAQQYIEEIKELSEEEKHKKEGDEKDVDKAYA